MSKRQFKPRRRTSGFRDARLIVIATEGVQTEKIYFNDLASDARFRNPKVHVEVLERNSDSSSPNHVIKLLDKFRRDFGLNKYDELWLVIDLDRWPIETLSSIGTQCVQKKYKLAISNPCFEVWLLLHIKPLDSYSPEELKEFTENKRVGGRTRLEKELLNLCGTYNKSKPDTSKFIPNVEIAVIRARTMDQNPDHRWSNQIQ